MEEIMQRYFFIILCLVFAAGFVLDGIPAKKEIRVWGGKANDFTDSDGNVWYGGQKEKQEWGG